MLPAAGAVLLFTAGVVVGSRYISGQQPNSDDPVDAMQEDLANTGEENPAPPPSYYQSLTTQPGSLDSITTRANDLAQDAETLRNLAKKLEETSEKKNKKSIFGKLKKK